MDTIITYHISYGLKVKSLGGLDHEQEFSSSKLAEFIEYAAEIFGITMSAEIKRMPTSLIETTTVIAARTTNR